MINRNDDRVAKPSFVPKFSDPDIIRAVLNSEIWKHLFLGEKKAAWLFFKAIVLFKMELFISPLRSVLRYGHGRRTTGIIITLMSALMMIAFNTNYVVGYLATFFPLAAPVIPFFMTSDQILAATIADIRSQYLLFFGIVYLVISIIHLVFIYKGGGTTHSIPTRRGTSLLYALLFNHLKLPEYIVQCFIEPILAISIGYVLLSSGTDFTCGLFLIIAGTCLGFQECFDGVSKFAMSR
jgi:hypothetical protein